MVFKHRFFNIDFRNDSINTQKDVVDAFFQDHTIEHWDISKNEVLFGTYDENNLAGATRFTIFEATNGIKTDLSDLNSSVNLANFVSNNKILKSRMVADKIILVQYIARV